MSGGPDEVQAAVDPEVSLLRTLRLLFLSHVGLVLVIDEIDDWRPRVTVVDIVTKTGCVNDGELDFELLLFKLCLDDLDLGELVELLVVAPGVVLGRRQLGSEEGVDESGLAETRFTCVFKNMVRRRLNPTTRHDAPTTIIVKWAPCLATILCL